MRVVYISTYPPIECGIGTYTQYLKEAIQRERNETFVISQVGAQGENVLPIFWQESISLAAQIFNVSDKITPDIIHIQHEFGLYGSQHGVQIAELILKYRLADVPVVTTLHTVNQELDPPKRILLKTIVEESGAIIVHETHQKKVLTDNFGHSGKIHIIPHGVREVSPIPNAKKKLEVEGKKVILLCGYFRPTKGFHKIVKWLPDILKKEKEAILIIAGKARTLTYREYQKTFFEAINNSPVTDNIIVLRGQFPQHTFDTIISASDVVVLPYEQGAQSGIMAHCFAFGKPVVVSDLPAFAREIKSSGGGLVCKTKQDYVDNISKILSDPRTSKKFRENISGYVQKKVGWSRVANQHIKVYQSIVKVPYGKARHVYFEE